MRAPASAAVRMPSSRVARSRSASASQACWTRPTRTGGAAGAWTRASEAGTSAAVIRRIGPVCRWRTGAVARHTIRPCASHGSGSSPRTSSVRPTRTRSPAPPTWPRSAAARAVEALDAGLPPRDVWLALCDAMDVPENRRHGLDKPTHAPEQESRGACPCRSTRVRAGGRRHPGAGAGADQAVRRLHRRRRHRRRRAPRRGVRLPRAERRRQVEHDAHGRLRLAGHRRAS